MFLKRRDGFFILFVGAILALLFFATLKPRPKNLPFDDQHRPLVEAVAHGEARSVVEGRCFPCHNPPS